MQRSLFLLSFLHLQELLSSNVYECIAYTAMKQTFLHFSPPLLAKMLYFSDYLSSSFKTLLTSSIIPIASPNNECASESVGNTLISCEITFLASLLVFIIDSWSTDSNLIQPDSVHTGYERKEVETWWKTQKSLSTNK